MIDNYIYRERFKVKIHERWYDSDRLEGYQAVVRGILGIALYTTSTHKEYDTAVTEAEWWIDHVIMTVGSKEYKGM